MEDDEIFKLYVRGSFDPKIKRVGACVECHRLMMVMYAKDLECRVITKAMHPGMKVPFLKHRDFVYDDVYKIEDYLEKFGKPMDTDNQRAKEVVATSKVFLRFSYVIKNPDPRAHDSLVAQLNGELRKLNNHLASSGTTFFAGDELSLVDCSLLPQLLHIQLALGKLHNYEIPEEFEALKTYQEVGEILPAFSDTRPDDSEIVHVWKEKMLESVPH